MTCPFRILPRITDRNAHFWQGGRDGELRFQRCRACGYYLHPPNVVCPKCLSKDIGIEAVSGRAEVHTFSINYQPWMPGLEPPFVLAIVALRRAGRPAPDDEHRPLPGGRRRRSACRCRSCSRRTRKKRSGSPSSSRLRSEAQHERARPPRGAARRPLGGGAVRHRAPPAPRPARAHARRVPRRDRGRRAHDRRHRRHLDVPGHARPTAGLLGWRCRRRARRAPARAQLVERRHRASVAARRGRRRLPRRVGGPRHARPVLPQRVRGERAGRGWSRRGDARWRRTRRRAPHLGFHGVGAAVLRAVGRDVDRDDGAAPLPRVRHDTGAARVRSR